MKVFNNSINRNVFFVLSTLYLLLVFASCKKEKKYVYEVTDVGVAADGSNKSNVKTTTEFISIAYSDLFGTTIPNDELVKLTTIYSSFGDKKLVEDMIIKNFLNKTGVSIPSKATMNTDVNLFLKNSYKKLFNREPNEFEVWSLKNTIVADTSITPELIYYSMMTSNEYRYY